VLMVLLAAVTLGALTRLGGAAPWSPSMNAWSGVPIPAQYVKGRTALERSRHTRLPEQAVSQTVTRWAATAASEVPRSIRSP